MNYQSYYNAYIALCKTKNQKPSREDFFGYLYGVANNTSAINRPNYGLLYTQQNK